MPDSCFSGGRAPTRAGTDQMFGTNITTSSLLRAATHMRREGPHSSYFTSRIPFLNLDRAHGVDENDVDESDGDENDEDGNDEGGNDEDGNDEDEQDVVELNSMDEIFVNENEVDENHLGTSGWV